MARHTSAKRRDSAQCIAGSWRKHAILFPCSLRYRGYGCKTEWPWNRSGMKVREVVKRLEDAGWLLDRQKGSHRQYKHPQKPGLMTVSGHLSDDVAPPTLASIRRQPGIDRLR
jgi:predicted RNA binding protein YcfA (HicA-like mRNA interferase family)